MSSENKKMKTMMDGPSPERVYAFSDGVFAIIITIMILELKKPEGVTFEALIKLWPTWISYIASYLFIAIVWINHHYLLRFANEASSRLMWANFAHLFSVSLIPFLTVWVAESNLSPIPVAMYAFVFFLVNATYLALVWETLCNTETPTITAKAMWLLHARSFSTLALFIAAMILAFWFPLSAFGLVCCCLALYLRPEIKMDEMGRPAPGMTKRAKNLTIKQN